jgi:hypothetical protein
MPAPADESGGDKQKEQHQHPSVARRSVVFKKVLKISAWLVIRQTQKRRTTHRLRAAFCRVRLPWGRRRLQTRSTHTAKTVLRIVLVTALSALQHES